MFRIPLASIMILILVLALTFCIQEPTKIGDTLEIKNISTRFFEDSSCKYKYLIEDTRNNYTMRLYSDSTYKIGDTLLISLLK